MSITFIDQPGEAYSDSVVPIHVTVTADPGYYDEIYVFLVDSQRRIISQGLRTSVRNHMGGTQSFLWSATWFTGLPTEQDYGFVVDLYRNGIKVARLSSARIRLKSRPCTYKIASFRYL